jgi:hypothetical protein
MVKPKYGGFIMKQLGVLILLIGYNAFIIAETFDTTWVLTEDGKINAKKIFVKDNCLRIILKDGTKQTISFDKLIAYSSDGKEFRKLPLYVKGKKTSVQVFMELLVINSDLELYKFCQWSYCPYHRIDNFMVFKSDSLIMAYDETSHP